MRPLRGFTLIELMVVIVIVAILMAVAIPAFTEQMRKSRRSDGIQALSDLSLKQEKWRSNNATYGTLNNINNGIAKSSDGNYDLVITFPAAGNCTTVGAPAKSNANSYILTATVTAAQANDSRCATLVLTNDCGTLVKTSTPAGNTCW